MKKNDSDSQSESESQINRPVLTAEKIELLRGLLDQAEHYLHEVRSLLFDTVVTHQATSFAVTSDSNGKVVEGVFNGEEMVSADGKTYPVPPNYASKSKLVVGDILKLTILADGSFVYKQINPVERQKLIGIVEVDQDRYFTIVEGKRYQILTAAATYYRVQPRSRVTIVIPRQGEVVWAALENVLEAK